MSNYGKIDTQIELTVSSKARKKLPAVIELALDRNV